MLTLKALQEKDMIK